MKIAEIRNWSDTDLVSKKRDARQEYFNLKMQQQSGSLEKPSRLNDLRKLVAKIETVATERKQKVNVKSRQPRKK
jgi:large subunit ribosomal protein L29